MVYCGGGGGSTGCVVHGPCLLSAGVLCTAKPQAFIKWPCRAHETGLPACKVEVSRHPTHSECITNTFLGLSFSFLQQGGTLSVFASKKAMPLFCMSAMQAMCARTALLPSILQPFQALQEPL